MSSPDEFWKETPQSLLRSKGDQGCSPCQKAARENMKHMQQMKGRAMDMNHSKVFAFGAGIALGALIMHMYMKRQ